ncbi:DUF6344 domain-containing protein [Streptomyces sp. NPDC045431]|uniref:DUF6344 domain-containing protein n=1 Tax=Streptomyces sp. NPDC045431 TaxID=3155613 RepID=UPI003402A352
MAAVSFTSYVRTLISPLIALLTALLGALGFGPGTAAKAAKTAPALPAASASASLSASAVVPVQRAASPVRVRPRALPPTIKQRIRAEAHGSSPSVRRLPAAAPAEPDPTDLALAA